MTIPLLLLVFTIPTLIYMAIYRRRGGSWSEALAQVGWQGARPVHFLWGLGIMLVVGALGWLALQFVPPEVLLDPNISVSAYAGMAPSLTVFLFILAREGVYVALGEEIFFRGWLGGWLVRRFGFITGNLLPACSRQAGSLFSATPPAPADGQHTALAYFTSAICGWLAARLATPSLGEHPTWLAGA